MTDASEFIKKFTEMAMRRATQQNEMGPDDQWCATCRYFTFAVGDLKDGEYILGNCRRYPPIHLFSENEGAGFPQVVHNNFCGEWAGPTEETLRILRLVND